MKAAPTMSDPAQGEKPLAEAATAAASLPANGRDAERGRESASVQPVYCALTPARRRFVLGVVTVAGLFGPLAGAIYLPSLPVLEREFGVGATALNATVSVFMVTFAFAVSAALSASSLPRHVVVIVDGRNLISSVWASRCSGPASRISGAGVPSTSPRSPSTLLPTSFSRLSPRTLARWCFCASSRPLGRPPSSPWAPVQSQM